MTIAKTILEQIRALDATATFAWGVRSFIDTGKGLKFKTTGMVRTKCFVEITLDEGQDLYDIEFFKMRTGTKKVIAAHKGIFVEDMVRTIDGVVG